MGWSSDVMRRSLNARFSTSRARAKPPHRTRWAPCTRRSAPTCRFATRRTQLLFAMSAAEWADCDHWSSRPSSPASSRATGRGCRPGQRKVQLLGAHLLGKVGSQGRHHEIALTVFLQLQDECSHRPLGARVDAHEGLVARLADGHGGDDLLHASRRAEVLREAERSQVERGTRALVSVGYGAWVRSGVAEEASVLGQVLSHEGSNRKEETKNQ